MITEIRCIGLTGPVTPGSRCGLGVRLRAGIPSSIPNPGLALRDLAGR